MPPAVTRNVHGSEAYLVGIGGTILSRQPEFILLCCLPRYRTGGVIQLLKHIFVCQRVISYGLSQMTAERLYDGKVDTPVGCRDCIPFYKIEESVCTDLVLAVQAVEIHDTQQRGFGNLAFRDVTQIHACRVALISDVQLELFFLHRVSVEAIDIFHHQVPAGGIGRVRCILQQFYEQALSRLFDVGRKFAYLIVFSPEGIFKGYCQYFIRLQCLLE